MRVKKCFVLLLYFLLLAGPVLAEQVPGNSNDKKEEISIQRFQKAQKALIDGKWLYYRRSIKKHLDQGVVVLKRVVETLPQMADAHYYLALLYIEKGEKKKQWIMQTRQ